MLLNKNKNARNKLTSIASFVFVAAAIFDILAFFITHNSVITGGAIAIFGKIFPANACENLGGRELLECLVNKVKMGV